MLCSTSVSAHRDFGVLFYFGMLVCLPISGWCVDKSGILGADETWSGAIEITSSVTIPEGITLTIQAGTVVKFNTNGNILADGTLSAVGTSGSPIYFTSLKDDTFGGDTNGDGSDTTPAPGDWQLIRLESGDTADVTLEHVEFRYNGAFSQPALVIRSGTLSIDNVTIKDGSKQGISFNSSASGNYQLNNLTLERIGTNNSDAGVSVSGTNAIVSATNLTTTDISGPHVEIFNAPGNWSSSGTTFSGVGIKAIKFRGGFVPGDMVLDDDVPYLLGGT